MTVFMFRKLERWIVLSHGFIINIFTQPVSLFASLWFPKILHFIYDVSSEFMFTQRSVSQRFHFLIMLSLCYTIVFFSLPRDLSEL